MCKCSEGLDHQILCIALIEHLNYRCLYIDTYKSRTESVSYIMIPSTHPTLLGHLQAGSSIPQKLQTAYTMFKAFCKHSRATPFVKSFTRDNLGWDSFAKYPEASFKGSDVKLLLGFLVDFMYHDETHQVNQVCCDALHAARCMDDFLRLVFTANRFFLSREEASAALNYLLMWHAKTHACARGCFDQRLVFFNLTPKFHYLQHVSDDIKKQLDSELTEILSPAIYATQMAEDYIGKSCRVAKTTHPCTAVRRTGQKWLVFCRQWWINDLPDA